MIGGALETHTAEEGDQAKRGTAVDGLGIRSFLYIYVMIYNILLSSYISPLFLFVVLEMSTIFGERLPLSGKGLHTQPHIGNDRNRYLWLKNLLQILSPTWYCQFYDTWLSNFMKHLFYNYVPNCIPPTTKNKWYFFITLGVRLNIFGIYFCYDSVDYLPVLPPTHTACQISRKSW